MQRDEEQSSKVLSQAQFRCQPYASRSVAKQTAVSTRSMPAPYRESPSDYARRQKRAPLE